MRRWISVLLPFVGLSAFAVIVVGTGPAKIADVFRAADPKGLIFAPLLVAAIMLVRGLRWRYIMHVVGIEYSVVRSASIWTIGFFASSVTPAKVGDVVRAFYIRDDTGKSFGEAFLTVFIDRLWDLMFVLVSGMVTVLLFSRYYIEIPSIWIVAGASVAIIGVVYLMMRRDMMKKLLSPVFNLLVPQRYKEKFSLNFHTFYDSLKTYNRGWRPHAVVGALTILTWSLIFLLAYYIAYILGIPVSWRYIFLIMPIVTLVELIPISVAGLGTRDATVIYFFSVVGIASAQAVGFSIAYLLIGTYLTALVGFFLWLRNPVRFGGE